MAKEARKRNLLARKGESAPQRPGSRESRNMNDSGRNIISPTSEDAQRPAQSPMISPTEVVSKIDLKSSPEHSLAEALNQRCSSFHQLLNSHRVLPLDEVNKTGRSLSPALADSLDQTEVLEESARETARKQFRNMPLYPTMPELCDEPIFLESNKISGRYDKWEDYLNVQFRLLRDFMAPLRRGIKKISSLMHIHSS